MLRGKLRGLALVMIVIEQVVERPTEAIRAVLGSTAMQHPGREKGEDTEQVDVRDAAVAD